jgi:alcohol dehydrogenase YqhD (iron-dependent ADH family)
LKKAAIKAIELCGVRPNPTYELIHEGIRLCKRNAVDIVVAVGGGSVIDSAKAIAIGAPYEGDVLDFAKKREIPKAALPVGVILTLPAAGSETSRYAVATYQENGYAYKRDVILENSYLVRPKFAILNPELTFTLPPFQTACGICDIMAHVMERYFTPAKNVELTDRLCESVLKTVIHNAYIVIRDPQNYQARSEIMWSGSIAHNDLLGTGRQSDWASHNIEMELSALYDIAHGAGLAIIMPAWMRHVYKENVERFVQYAVEVWNVDYDYYSPDAAALEGIRRLEAFYKEIGLPTRLRDLDIPDARFEEMAQKAGKAGSIKKMTEKDILAIFRMAM